MIAILDNIGWLLIDKVLRMGIGLIVGAWIARYLGPEQFGKLGYTLAFVALFQSANSLGMDNIAIREMTRSPESTPGILGTVFSLRLVAALLLYIGSLIAILILKPNDDVALFLVSIIAGIILFQPLESVDLWFQSRLQSRTTVKAKLTAFCLATFLKILFILTGQPLEAFAWIVLLEAITAGALLIYSYMKTPSRTKWMIDYKRGKAMLSEGGFFLASGILLTAYMQVDKIWIEHSKGVIEVSLYIIAATPVTMFFFLPMIICSSLAPKMANLTGDDSRDRFFVKLTSTMFWGTTAIAIVLFMFSDSIIDALYGPDYQRSADLLKILSPMLIPAAVSVANDYYSLSSRRSHVTLIRTSAGLGVNVWLNYFLIEPLGAYGAAISSLIASLCSNTVIYWVLVPRSYRIFVNALILPFANLQICKLNSD